ncbi:MAG: hypothetical protein HFI89_04270 [Lachnospiraceae bacterium]|nr:hypothetical protein [Lachnospiraceae bacterium]
MKGLKMALHTREGLIAIGAIVVGIIIACIGGNLMDRSKTISDIVVVAGCITSIAGTQNLCQLIIRLRGDD